MGDVLSVLRDRTCSTAAFREASHDVCDALLGRLRRQLAAEKVDPQSVVLVFIMRAAFAFLDAATSAFPDAPVGIIGLRRDEKTAEASCYYENLPALPDGATIALFDPMLATGGSAVQAARALIRRGADPSRIRFVGVLAAPEGVKALSGVIPEEQILLAAVDEGLDARKFIVPGLGDFGDRWFGTPQG